MTRTARLATVTLPDFGRPAATPEPLAATYAGRLVQLRERMAQRGYDRLVVYADREHSANLSWLTGFDPRFEEAILIVGPDGDPAVLVGNECVGTARAAPLPMRVVLHQDLSLPSQPRDRSRPLTEELGDVGVVDSARVGVVGGKPAADRSILDAPSFLVDAVRGLVGPGVVVDNATDLFVAPADGLRVINDVDTLAAMEAAAVTTSSGVLRLIRGLTPGLRERDAVALLGWDGSPLSCHLMLTAGERARLGLLSPGDRPIQRGDPFTTAFGIWGSLTCRAGFVASDAGDLPAGIGDYVDKLVGPYFAAIAEWYEALHVGQTGGTLQAIIDRHLGDPFFGIFLNPGHQISLDEWVNSPVWPGSTVELRSGMAMQVDVIPATGSPWFTTNIEDTIALADDGLRSAFAAAYPEAWARVVARRSFMATALGIELHPDVLPFSNIPAWLPPFLLGSEQVMVMSS
jgi:hypothetical protein